MHIGRAGALAVWAAVTIVATTGCGGSGAGGTSPVAVPSPSSSASPSAPNAAVAAGPSSLEVECTKTGTRIVGDTVAAQPDGVHLHIRNSSGEARAFEVEGVGGGNAPAMEATEVWIVAPGPARIRCQSLERGADADWAAFTVVDPAGLHVPDRVTCALSSTSIMDYAWSATGEHGDPVEIAQRDLRGVREGDVVERAGYPATDVRKVRVVRGEDVVMVITFEPALDGGWLRSTVEACNDADLTWAS